jgi:Fic family protein
MKIPLSPPKHLFDQNVHFKEVSKALTNAIDFIKPTTDKGEYLHWDKLRHLQPPASLSSEAWWFAIKLARKAIYKQLPFKDKNAKPFVFATPDNVLHQLHFIDRSTGIIPKPDSYLLNTAMRDSYLTQSLINEAITSSQLEGASTTRKVAQDMLRMNRKPRTNSEQMIYNNYHAMQFIREIRDEELTIDIILEIHRILTNNTLENKNKEGALRISDDIEVGYQDKTLHIPPKANELKKRLKQLCDFANDKEDKANSFIHPVIKAVLLHFMLAYDHPFSDGNGRTARALFYWSMAHQHYWLIEFISISEIIKLAPLKYLQAYLYTETDDNDLTYFLIHQLNIIVQAINSLYDYLNKQIQEISDLEHLLHTNPDLQLNYRQIALIKHALKHPNTHYQITSHCQSHHVVYDTGRTDLLMLVKLGLLLKQKTGKAFTFIAPTDLRTRLAVKKKK